MKILKQLSRLPLFMNLKRCRRLGAAPDSILFPVIWVTYRCNLDCRMCNQWKTGLDASAQELSTREWFSFIDSVKRMHAAVIVITGGEPLLREDIFEIIKHIRGNKVACHLCTNGTLLNEVNVRKLKDSGVNSVSVSLDSDLASIHDKMRRLDCFETVVNGIKLMRSLAPEIKIGINYVVTKINFRNLDRMLAFAQKLGVDQIKFDRVHTNLMHRGLPLADCAQLLFTDEDLVAFKEEVAKLIKAASKTRLLTNSRTFLEGMPVLSSAKACGLDCYAGYVSCAVDPYGRVSPCDNFDGQESVRRQKPLEEIWQSASFRNLRTKVQHCDNLCWDTTHTELNIRCSGKYCAKELRQIIKEIRYYL
jgi:AdoMet-dependent heme synthase